ncbi:hypothetical protein M8J77_010696 [Diaphorina citri]|nr:hypothetical protein M8J77_010696 [Diaphorina citri]
MEGATRIKVPIPVTLIEKHVLMSYVKTIEEFTITLNNIHFVFDKKMNLLERSLANEYEEERKQYEAETKRKQRHLSQLVRCNNKERSALKTELRTLKNNNRSRRERLQIEFCEEFVQQALKVKQLQLEIQLGSQQYERKREQIMEHFEQEKNKEMRMFNLEQDKKKTYMNHLQSQLTKFNSGNIYVDKEVKKLDKFYSHLIDEKRFKNYEIEVGVEKLLRDKKHEYNDLVANIYVLTGDLKALYEQKVLVDQQTAPYVWSLKEMEHFISVSDKDENMIVEPNRDYEQAIDIYEAKCQSLESCLRDKDRIIREKRDELQVLEDKVLQIQDRLLSKIRKQFQLKDCLAEVSNKLIPSHKKLVHLESEIDSTLQDLSDMLFKPPKLSQKCNDPQDFHRRELSTLTGSHHLRTTAYHPAANGMVERLHRQLKAAIKCHHTARWTDILPTVLLGIRAAWRDDFKASCAELVYGEPLRLPGEFLASKADLR